MVYCLILVFILYGYAVFTQFRAVRTILAKIENWLSYLKMCSVGQVIHTNYSGRELP